MKMTLTPAEINTLLAEHPYWSLEAESLVRSWTFDDFAQALAFVNRIGHFAEQADHHPDIDLRYNRVKLSLISHDVAGLSSRDARMVRQIDESFPS